MRERSKGGRFKGQRMSGSVCQRNRSRCITLTTASTNLVGVARMEGGRRAISGSALCGTATPVDRNSTCMDPQQFPFTTIPYCRGCRHSCRCTWPSMLRRAGMAAEVPCLWTFVLCCEAPGDAG